MTEIFGKLNYKSQDPLLVWGAPASFERELKEMSEADFKGIHQRPE
jgi:hypothetical protein